MNLPKINGPNEGNIILAFIISITGLYGILYINFIRGKLVGWENIRYSKIVLDILFFFYNSIFYINRYILKDILKKRRQNITRLLRKYYNVIFCYYKPNINVLYLT